MHSEIKKIVYISIIAFSTNLIWENAHSFLYTNISPVQLILPALLFPSLIDVLSVLIIYFVVKTLNGGKLSVSDFGWRTFLYTLVLAFTIAFIGEKNGLWLGLFSYKSTTPLLPVVNVGVTALLQMVTLAPLSIFLGLWLKDKL